MSVVFTRPRQALTLVPWGITCALLLVWGVAALTANRMGGYVNGFLIAGAVMTFVSLVLGRQTISPLRNDETASSP